MIFGPQWFAREQWQDTESEIEELSRSFYELLLFCLIRILDQSSWILICYQHPCLFLDKKRWNIKMEQASTVRCWLLIIIDIDHADKALIIINNCSLCSESNCISFLVFELKKLWQCYFKKHGGQIKKMLLNLYATLVSHIEMPWQQHQRNFKNCSNPCLYDK